MGMFRAVSEVRLSLPCSRLRALVPGGSAARSVGRLEPGGQLLAVELVGRELRLLALPRRQLRRRRAGPGRGALAAAHRARQPLRRRRRRRPRLGPVKNFAKFVSKFSLGQIYAQFREITPCEKVRKHS